jgi:hypothetical protein
MTMDESSAPPAPAGRDSLPSIAHLNGGIREPALRSHLIKQLIDTMWRPGITEEDADDLLRAAIATLDGLKPKDEAEGMLGVQMIATHHAAVECLKLAIIDRNGRDRSLLHAGKLLNIYIRQLQVLDRRRGAGGHQVNVGTVNVEPGAQAIVGAVTAEARPPRDGQP